MKKCIIILIMLVYGLPSTGASLYLHYCCGKLDAISFSVQHKEGCQQKESKGKTCCNNIAIDLKLDADQQPGAALLVCFNQTAVPVMVLPVWQVCVTAATIIKSNWPTGPPFQAATLPVYLKNCIFRI